jgi:hypothetical protein
MRRLFDQWERDWHQGQYELIPDCIHQNYVRHDEAGAHLFQLSIFLVVATQSVK